MSANLRGISLMVLAMLGMAGTDTVIKLMAAHMPAPQALLIVGMATGALFSVAALLRGEPLLTRAFFHPAVLARSLAEAVAMLSVVIAIALVPLSTVSALMQMNPILVTLGAALFFGETVGWRRWMAILAGCIGMLMILRPGMESFDPNTLIAVLAALALSVRDLTTRATPARVPSLTLAAWGFVLVGPATVLALTIGPGPVSPHPSTLWLAPLGIAATLVGYLSLTASVRVGELASVAPFRYSRLLFAALIGITLFGERPDFWTILGSLVIIAAGLYAFLRERRHPPA